MLNISIVFYDRELKHGFTSIIYEFQVKFLTFPCFEEIYLVMKGSKITIDNLSIKLNVLKCVE